jgi:tRNA-dihydrouridine synthase
MPKIGNIILPEFPLLLAPMEDVSDPPFRAVCKDNGADLMYSEFISSEGLIRDAIKSKMKLDFSEEERPFGIQIFGGDEEAMAMSARICETVNPDLVDINFGCPVKSSKQRSRRWCIKRYRFDDSINRICCKKHFTSRNRKNETGLG